MKEPFDNCIEVDDAIRLNEAFRQFEAECRSEPLRPSLIKHPIFERSTRQEAPPEFYGGEAAYRPWVQGAALSEIALQIVRDALKTGALPVYIIGRNQLPARLNPNEFARHNWHARGTIVAGFNKNANGNNALGSPYHGANLWVKLTDLSDFRAKNLGRLRKSAKALSNGRGRKKGSGSMENADAPPSFSV